MLSPDPYIERRITDLLLTGMREARVTALLGARQAGKTTLVRRLAEDQLAAAYVSLDDEAVRGSAAADAAGFIAGLPKPVVIDEIQRVPQLMLAIKSEVDRSDQPGQFLITGSANLRLLPAIPDALPGRVDYHTLWPLAQAEIEGGDGSLLAELFEGRAPALSGCPAGIATYAERLLAGGLPEAGRRSEETRRRFLSGYVRSIVDRDIPDTSRARNPSQVGDLLRLIAARSGSLARWDKLGTELGVDGKTAKAHAEALERLFLVRIRRAWHVNLGKRQVKAPKLYAADSGVLAALAGADTVRLQSDGGLAGSIVETFVANEVERLASWTNDTFTFWHYREDRREVDIVIEKPSGEVIGLEVKAGATTRSSDFAGLLHLRDRLGDRFRAGVVVNTSAQTVPRGDRLWAVPLMSLWRTEPGASRT